MLLFYHHDKLRLGATPGVVTIILFLISKNYASDENGRYLFSNQSTWNCIIFISTVELRGAPEGTTSKVIICPLICLILCSII